MNREAQILVERVDRQTLAVSRKLNGQWTWAADVEMLGKTGYAEPRVLVGALTTAEIAALRRGHRIEKAAVLDL